MIKRRFYRDNAISLPFVALLLGGCLGAVLLLALFVPFRVRLLINVDVARDSVSALSIAETREEDTRILRAGESLEARSGETVTLLIEGGGYAYLIGPANVEVVHAWRTGTTLGHILDENVEYDVLLAQEIGTALYYFNESEPSLEALNLRVRLPDGEFVPEWDCFQVTVGQGGQPSQIGELPCTEQALDAQITPLVQPTLPALPVSTPEQ